MTVLARETDHLDKEAMKNMLLHNFNYFECDDDKGNKLIDSNYLNALRNIIDNIK